MSDALTCGRRPRLLNVMDDYSRECLNCIADTSPSGSRALSAVAKRRRLTCTVVSDNATELTNMLSSHGARTATSSVIPSLQGKPQQKGFVESLNCPLRDECMNEHLFHSLAAVRRIIGAWRTDYTAVRSQQPRRHGTRRVYEPSPPKS